MSDERCDFYDCQSGKRCMLIAGHRGMHRWWWVRDPERPTWEDGEHRTEWAISVAGHRQDDGRETT